jgi:uncharacterized protein (DUF1501 family)
VFTRRDFLKSSSLLALAPTVPMFLARAARATRPQTDGRVLVVIQLDGGNDGINTVVPHRDEGYARQRRELRLAADRLVRINDRLGFHPSLRAFGTLLDAGRLAVVQGVGYPNPSRSHFRSMAIWHSARLDPEEHTGIGWLGRALDGRAPRGGEPPALLVGASPPPVAIRGRRLAPAALDRAEDFALEFADARSAVGPATAADDLSAFVRRSMLDTYAVADRLATAGRSDNGNSRYPATGLGARLALVARLLKAGFATRIYYTLQSGYDTHSSQFQTHANLLSELGAALKAFLDDLSAARLDDRVVVLCFSEFGRTVRENASAGTDHGTAGPVFVAGTPVRGDVIGATPSLTDLDPRHGDLRMAIDFRRVYGTILDDWLGLPSRMALDTVFERLPLFRV